MQNFLHSFVQFIGLNTGPFSPLFNSFLMGGVVYIAGKGADSIIRFLLTWFVFYILCQNGLICSFCYLFLGSQVQFPILFLFVILIRLITLPFDLPYYLFNIHHYINTESITAFATAFAKHVGGLLCGLSFFITPILFFEFGQKIKVSCLLGGLIVLLELLSITYGFWWIVHNQ